MKRKKIAFFLLAVCFCITVLPATAQAKALEGSCGESATYSFDAETGILTISGKGSVTLKETPIYDLRTSIKSIVITNGVTCIGEDGFSGCVELTQISIPDSVTEIGDGAFFRCRKITEIKLPSKLTRIERHTFHGCDKLVTLWIPGGVNFLGDMCFEGCNSLRDVHYDNTAEQWAQILCEDFSWALVYSTVSFNSSKKPFTDVNKDASYYDAVLWAFEQGIVNGTSKTTFTPEKIFTRAQAATALWRAAGSPEPESPVNPFPDVVSGSFYEKAVLWAVEQGIILGMGDGTFSPSTPCSEAQIQTLLWRYVGAPGRTDSGVWYSDALRWAAEIGLLDGTDEAIAASVRTGCSRGKAMEFLYRIFATSP